MTPISAQRRRRWLALHELPARVPLRIKLVAALLGLVALALLVTGVAAAAALRGYLLNRVDAQLRAAAAPIVARVERGQPTFDARRGRFDLPSAFYVQLSAADGVAVGQLSAPLHAERSPPALPRLDAETVARLADSPFTVGPVDHGIPWRALVVPLADGSRSVTVAVSLDDIRATVGRLVAIEVVVGVVVLAALAGLGYAAVRSSLRPLSEVEATAAAIAAGDLTRRVPERDPRTEVGRLSRALNGMLAQIEAAFRARQSSEAAARASEERMRRFVADASHELRTPLTSIRGYAELHRQGAATDPADVARVLRRIEDEAARMGLLVEDLLLLARLDQQRPLDRRPVDLLTVAADAVQDARAVSGDHPTQLRVVDTDPAPVVLGDEARLRQVVGNLVRNALVHTPPGTPVTVTVGTTRDGSALLEVADTGPGMSAADAARAFERFYRADPSRSRAHGGTGLGLSIVAALVAAHGGTVALDTNPGAGVRVRVTLPLASQLVRTAHSGSFQPGGRQSQ